MKTKYKLLVIGDTFAAYGISSRITDCCIVDKRAQIGWDFINTFDYGENWSEACRTSVSADLKKELIRRRILNETGLVQCPALAPVMYQRVKNTPISRLYMTQVTSVSKKDGYYQVELFHDSGFYEIIAEKVVDTCGETFSAVKKEYRAVIDIPEPDMQFEAWTSGVRFIKSALSEVTIVSINADRCEDISQARQKLHEIWSQRPKYMKNAKIAYAADEFFKVYAAEPIQEHNGITYLNSQAFENPLKAIDAGYEWAQAYEKPVF